MLIVLGIDEATQLKCINAGNGVMTSGTYKPVFTKIQAVESVETLMTTFVD
jgi:hypothetical protein